MIKLEAFQPFSYDLEIEADLEQLDGFLFAKFMITGEVERIRWPKVSKDIGRKDNLWKHSCFEVFLGSKDKHYEEWNFSVTGDWQAYQFLDYRKRVENMATAKTPEIRMNLTATSAEVVVKFLALGDWSKANLCAVIEDRDLRVAHYALTHSSDRPDFHQADAFVFEL